MKKLSILLLSFVALLVSCKKTPEVNLKYVDVERDLITVGASMATIQCDYEYIATLKKAFLYYGEGSDTTNMTSAEMSVVQKTLYVELSGLKENTTYNFYYEFANGFNSMRSGMKAFKTEGSGTTITLPTVVTAEVTEITASSAHCGGEVINDGGVEVTERGVCWSTNENPTLNNNHVAVGTGMGVFTAVIDSLTDNTKYHLRAYAVNEKGVAYGLDREFVTLTSGGVPVGAIEGLFTINPNGNQVYFSQGNLQYRAATNKWRFAENQWDYVGSQTPEIGSAGGTVSGSDNASISPTYDGWIDLFGWGTSGWDNGNIYYRPYDYEYSTYFPAHEHGNGYGPTDGIIYYYDLVGTYANADWGIFNEIINGGNNVGVWRTLSMREWKYILFTRSTNSGIRYAKAQVNGVNGVLLLPDEWNPSICELMLTDVPTSDYATNVFNSETWPLLETNGVVFLPAAGYRLLTSPKEPGDAGCYWSSSAHFQNTTISAWDVMFSGLGGGFAIYVDDRFVGRSVRLVHDAIQYPSNTVPTVNTFEVSEVTSNSALLAGEVTSDGGAEVPVRGFCWSMNENPTLSDNRIVSGYGTGDFTASLSDLEANTTYHVRAYAGNGLGVAYGSDKTFRTQSNGGGSGAPEGAINGLFTINANGDKVYFSQGNLQYQASTNTWRFADMQWDYEGNNNNQISPNNTYWIDLFGWGTSGYHDFNDPNNLYYQPWSSTVENVNANYNVWGYGPSTNMDSPDLTDSSANYDWGVYNSISNGGNTVNLWRTLTKPEWKCVFQERATSTGMRYAMARVNDVNGVILLPDNWDENTYVLYNTDSNGHNFNDNVINTSQWNTLQNAGAVFLPAAGKRYETSIEEVGSYGYYWTASSLNSSYYASIILISGGMGMAEARERFYGHSVRLVQDAN